MRCQGRPEDGVCPDNRNDDSVHNTIADLFLCHACEDYRWPKPKRKTSNDDVGGSKPSKNQTSGSTSRKGRQPRKTVPQAVSGDVITLPVVSACSSVVPTTHQQLQTVVNINADPANDSSHEVVCPVCSEAVEQQQCIECCSCKHTFHQQCTGLSSEVFDVLLSIVSVSGWVCQQCRDDLPALRSSIVKHDEELSDLRVSVAWLWEELNNIKKVKGLTPDNSQTPVTAPSVPPSAASTTPQPRATELEVHRVLQDNAKRKLNVVVTGLPECVNDESTQRQQDCAAFIQFCEENLSVKPSLAKRGCSRIGQRIDNRPRKLLVHLTSEQSATSLLSASKNLQRSADTRNFYINPDLSPAEAQLAYELRQKRRAAAAAKRAAASDHPTVTVSTSVCASSGVDGNLSVTSAEFYPAATAVNVTATTSALSTSPPATPNAIDPVQQPFQ